jgi:3-phenylpropionate/cinnamic acid dioxygenase small subunit
MDAQTPAMRSLVDHDTLSLIERFLYQEAAMLDSRDYAAWSKILADDVRYQVFAKINRDASIGGLEFALINETPIELKQRIDQISTPKLTHAENPPSITRRSVTNVMASRGASQNEFEVTCNVLVYRTTVDLPEGGFYSAQREDLIREVGGEFRLARRVVHLDQTVMFGAISILF